MEKLLSIVIPVYNAEKYLHLSIESVLKNEYKNFELILIDDGSLDSSFEICQHYANNDKRISVFRQKNKGTSETRNRGLELAKGEYVAFLDSDDWIDKDMYSYLISILEKNPDVAYAECGKIWHYHTGEKILHNKPEHINKIFSRTQALEVFFYNELFHWGVCDMVFRKSCIEGIKFSGVYAEDMRFHLKVFDKNNRFFASDATDTPKYHYNKQLDSNLMSKSFNNNHLTQLDFYIEFKAIAEKYGLANLADKCQAEICKRLLSYSAKVTHLKLDNHKDNSNKFVKLARNNYRNFFKCKNLNFPLKIDLTLFCAFPKVMNLINIKLV